MHVSEASLGYSTAPILFCLRLTGVAGFLKLEPVRRAARPIARAQALRDDALAAKPAGMQSCSRRRSVGATFRRAPGRQAYLLLRMPRRDSAEAGGFVLARVLTLMGRVSAAPTHTVTRSGAVSAGDTFQPACEALAAALSQGGPRRRGNARDSPICTSGVLRSRSRHGDGTDHVAALEGQHQY